MRPEATAALTRLVANQTVQLEVRSQDRYERLVAVVFVGDLNVNARLVQDGHAWAYRQYLKKRDGSGARFCNWEAAARSTRRGIWSLSTDNWIYPSDWRRYRRGDRDTVEDFSEETAARCIAAIGQSRPKAPRTARAE